MNKDLDLSTAKGWNTYKAYRCEVLARLARRRGNPALRALWELYARQYRGRGDAW